MTTKPQKCLNCGKLKTLCKCIPVYTKERWPCPECDYPGAIFVSGKFQYCPICGKE